MLSVLDHCLLRRGGRIRDHDFGYRRVDGNFAGRMICFLPYGMRYSVARGAGLVPGYFLACFEIPAAIVSAVPSSCRAALDTIVADAECIARRAHRFPSALTIIGYSMGSFPAAVLAARLGARLVAVATADRGDLMMWESPAAGVVKARAEMLGFHLDDFTLALHGVNPIDQIGAVARGSVFLVGTKDPFIPATRREALRGAMLALGGAHRFVDPPTGHIGSMLSARSIGVSL